MKILFYSHSSTAYGATSSMVNLIMGIKKLYPFISTHVILPKQGKLESVLNEKKIPYTIIINKPWFYNGELSNKKKESNVLLWYLWFLKNKWQKFFFNIFLLKRHLASTKKISPDYIYVNSSLAPMGGYVSLKLGIPLIWHHRETVNDSAYNYHLEYPNIFKYIYAKTKLHVFTSDFLAKNYSKFLSNGESLVTFNGVKFESDIKFDQKLPKSKRIKLGLVGRINSQKGQKEVIEVFHKLSKNKNYELHIIGDGNKDYIEAIGCKTGQENLIFHGFLKKEEIFEKFDFLIMNSTNEAFGRVVAEANYYGIPVIAKRSGAFPEIIDEKKNGFLFNDANELQVILENLDSYFEIEEYKKLSKNAKIKFEENFSIEDYTTKIIEKIKSLK
ncbi:glycosyltransferase family 4 protein [Salegentibacter mishustinae]|uniref:glycosyltransferase family 4 protein n=1 Tax=Salegentibacter mishustinae TaxID=270918 RepID=UPI001CE1D436|nr:glycosyltransferase family 4 protein [Salegentibacter mishustinae]UBZ06860.1 glycosyltransferase family 4 protein [Salegentibacter mishustinae]